jgi:uronate dehydrogenase
MLWSWLSFGDCVRLVEAALSAPRVGFSIVYGTSDNAARAVTNARAMHVGFHPQDSADAHRASILARTERPDPSATASRVVGGSFAATGHPDDGE